MPERNSVWLRPAKQTRNPPALDLDQIVAAAVALLDEESVSGLTMRKLAARLDAAPMTLYGYVATKDDLLELAVDAVFAEALAADPVADDWRAALTAIGHRTFLALVRHPWAAALVGDNPPLGPAAVAQFGTILRVLTAAGFTGGHLDSALTGFYYYVLGAALAESAWTCAGRASSFTAADISRLTSADGQDVTPVAAYFERYPDTDPVQRFGHGLRAVLNGLDPT
ncbi:TetR/AcrR family transcriptional regulator [Nocardia brasiliensis]|uniref:TetR/AcrR family transcriptional regulator n=1 Tax=Nocardia brasiliensis TaxID=37326 RepID=UPI0018958E0E|nr:TetR/AcrR family transcriptional regulator [Nocardia brasiliensis]MBF6126752.1 TetR/AcrR family transcriptional regulator C-terminal domain-containing protein [Nocardia brasiliensis]